MVPRSAKDTAIFDELRHLYPSVGCALFKIAELEAALTLPKGTVHIISDIHGEYKKLRHIINNASGDLKPLVLSLFEKRLSKNDLQTLLNLLHYPQEAYALALPNLNSSETRESFVLTFMLHAGELMRELAKKYPLPHVESLFPAEERQLLRELLFAPQLARGHDYFAKAVKVVVEHQNEANLLRVISRVVRNLLISEIIVAGDFGDRGPRIDKVIDYVKRQPRVRITWGNHDASWMAACLGHEASIATVIRISLRYRRLSQLEEGYGIPMAPLEKLAHTVYEDDPAECFACKGEGLRDATLMARMQKAMAIIQFKLEGQLAKRNEHFKLADRNLLEQINPKNGTLKLANEEFLLKDKNFPTVDWGDPYALSPEEQACINRIRASFLQSPRLWEHMRFLCDHGCMYLIRDNHLIFHACVPVDQDGKPLALEVDNLQCSGRALFDTLNRVVPRAFRERRVSDLDLLWYLWGGAVSPLFGKDKMATFETYFLAEKTTHKEHKNPYFSLIHHKEFCKWVLNEFGVDATVGLIVNGHVPVKIEAGESPLKKSEMAVTIDGAFSEAYGDKGYTLVLEAQRTFLAQHHHFESIEDVIRSGSDIVPLIQDLRRFSEPRTVRDTERGPEIAARITLLKELIRAYQDNLITETLPFATL